MKFAAVAEAPPHKAVDLIGITAFEEDLTTLDPLTVAVNFAALLDTVVGPELGSVVRQTFTEERFRAKIGQSVLLQAGAGALVRRIAIVGGGSRASFRSPDARHLAAGMVRIANKVTARSLLVAHLTRPDEGRELDRTEEPDHLTKWLEGIVEGAVLGAYRFDKYLGAEKITPPTLEDVFVQVPGWMSSHASTAAIGRGLRVAHAVAHARDLVNEPAGTMTPAALAAVTSERAKAVGLGVTVLGPAACQERGMGLFLAVSQGSSEEPRFIHLSWVPPNPTKRVVLVGKGVTFDSGGLSLKTTEGMLGMKADMAGAAAVFSAISVAAQEHLPVEVHALGACTENMPSGKAYKLGDVLRSMAGKTVEINNTDAEGRLTMADAITYGLGLRPDVILDFATLTGACVVALGPHTAGAMTNDQVALDRWMAAARNTGEDIWPLPLPPRLSEQLKSEIADLRNTGERWGGALTAGLFLREFVGTTPWIHVDIAGPATTDKEWGCYGKGGTGFAVATIVEYLRGLGTS